MDYSLGDIRTNFGSATFVKGQAYFEQDRVVSCMREGERIISCVEGRGAEVYDQTILIKKGSGKISLVGECSCPVGFNCKHVAAALIYGVLDGDSGTRPAVPDLNARVDEILGRKNTAPAQNKSGLAKSVLAKSKPEQPARELLPAELVGWLASLEQVEVTESENYPANIAQRIVYVLGSLETRRAMPSLGLEVITTRLQKNGTFSNTTYAYHPANAFSGTRAKYLRPSDLKVMKALLDSERGYVSSAATLLSSQAGLPVLQQILSTGRARWQSLTGVPMAWGEPVPGKIVWSPFGHDAMIPLIETDAGVLALQAFQPLYVDVAKGLIGEIEIGLPTAIITKLLNAPPVPLQHLQGLASAMAARLPKMEMAHPPLPEAPILCSGPPVPVLKLFGGFLPVEPPPGQNRHYGYYGQEPPKEKIGLARLTLRYDKVTIGLGETGIILRRVLGRTFYEVHRDDAAERAALQTLLSGGFGEAPRQRRGVPPSHLRDFLPDGGESGWFDALHRDVPRLRQAGFEVEIAKDFPVRVLEADGEIDAHIEEGSGIDWLELGLGIMVDGIRLDLIAPVVAFIGREGFDTGIFDAREADDDPIYLPLGDGRFIALPPARFVPILEAIYELVVGGAQTSHGKMRLTRADVLGLNALEAATTDFGIVWQGGESIRAMGRKLTSTDGIPSVEFPASFTATLRPYQVAGVAWMAFLRDLGLGGILADDMGLGKTVQTLALIAIEKAAGRLDRPVLVIAPTSLMANWFNEAEKFTPDLKVLILQGNDRKLRFEEIGQSDIVLTTYPLIARDSEVLGTHAWHMLFLDEAQTIKNPNSMTTRLIRSIDARQRFCLTGTPLENHLGELWSLFAFASPGFLGDRQSFAQNWRTPIEKKGDVARGKLLARRIKPFMLRRTKGEVAHDLPPKTEIVERIDMLSPQRDIYESIRLAMHAKVRDAIAAKGFASSRIIILDALLKMRQACCDPRLLKLGNKAAAKAGSAKLERLQEMLVELLDEGRKIIIFSQFTSMLELIRLGLEATGTPYAILTGDTRDRPAAIKRFQGAGVSVFLVSLKAGGTGLNLTAADTVILYDPWWNPAVEEQAIDRAHRIGQNKPVFVYKLVMSGTIEEKMEVLKAKKRALAESIFDADGTPTLAMTEADLDMLFG